MGTRGSRTITARTLRKGERIWYEITSHGDYRGEDFHDVTGHDAKDVASSREVHSVQRNKEIKRLKRRVENSEGLGSNSFIGSTDPTSKRTPLLFSRWRR